MAHTVLPVAEDVVTHADETVRQHRIWHQVNLIKKVSDRWVGFGPFGVGMDTFLSFMPWAGVPYSLGAGGLLLYHGVKAKASPWTLARMVAYLVLDAGTDTIPFVGWTVDALFPGQLLAAKALQRDIENRFGAPPDAPLKERMVKVKKAR